VGTWRNKARKEDSTEEQYEEIQGKAEEERRDKECERTERRQVIGLHRHRWVPI